MRIGSATQEFRTDTAPSIKTFAKIGLLVGGLVLAAKAVQKVYNYLVTDRPFPYVSKECSPEARSYLQQATPFLAPKNIKDFSLLRGYFKAATQAVSDRDRALYIKKTEEKTIGGVSVLVATPKEYPENSTKILVYIHGGAWVIGDPDHLYQVFAPISHGAQLKTYAIRYRLAPEHPYPDALNDCLAVYEELLKTYQPKDIYFLGDSAGANLCIATILKARDQGLEIPRAVVLESPVVDITKSGETHHTLVGRDPKFRFEAGLKPYFDVYSKEENNPLVSVIHADFKKGFPPVAIHVGSREILLSDSCRFHEKLLHSKQPSSLLVLEGLWHGFKEHGMPDSARSIEPAIDFFKSYARN